jgi:hypothetical protein
MAAHLYLISQIKIGISIAAMTYVVLISPLAINGRPFVFDTDNLVHLPFHEDRVCPGVLWHLVIERLNGLELIGSVQNCKTHVMLKLVFCCMLRLANLLAEHLLLIFTCCLTFKH